MIWTSMIAPPSLVAGSPISAASAGCATPIPPPLPALDTHRLDGEWTGRLSVGGVGFWEDYQIAGDRVVRRTLFDPVPRAGSVTRLGTRLGIRLPDETVTGAIDPAGDAITARAVRPGAPPVSLRLVRHPQTPVPPLPYRSASISLFASDGVRLAGTITLPAGTGAHPALILVPGSRPADRDYVEAGASPAQRPYAVLADLLTRAGIATLRLDDRGVGLSGGNSLTVSPEQRVRDLALAAAWLANQASVDPRRIGLLGHSAGALLAMRALAAGTPNLAFAVLVNAPGTPATRYAGDQAAAVAGGLGLDQAAQQHRRDEIERIDRAVVQAPNPAAARTAIDAALRGGAAPVEPSALNALTAATFASAPLYRFLLTYDPAPDLGRIQQPLLVVEGGRDVIINGGESAARIREAGRGAPGALICLLPTLDHAMRDQAVAPGANPDDGAETISPSLAPLITGWMERMPR